MRRAALLLTVILTILLGSAGAATAVDDVGYRDFSFGPFTGDPTGQKPQSKLWFNDGTWWASMFNRSVEEYHIYRYDRGTHTWSDTGTLIDERNTSHADTLWDGSRLYVATAGASSTNSNHGARILRYSYNPATRTYSLDPGFPLSGVSNGGMEAIVLDKDTTGKLWVTYTQNSKVYVNRSLSSQQSWGTPFVLPVNGTSVDPDDISSVVAFDSQIGIMWSNQVDSAMYFATHRDGDADNVWQESRTAIQGPNYADDHISLRSLQVDDVSGRVFAVIKTSLNDLPNPNPNAPLIHLLARDRNGDWMNSVFGRVSDNHTRPTMMIDEEHRELYVFATNPCCDGGAIFYKKSPLSNISFPSGVGTPFIQSATDTHIDNATSTKQNVNSATGLMVLASDYASQNYLHNIMDLKNVDTVAPTVTAVGPQDGAPDVSATANMEATFSEAMDSSTINGSTFTLAKQGASQPVAAQVTYDPANKRATLDPDADLEAGSTYTATIKGGGSGVKDPAGNPLGEDESWSFTTAAAPPPQDTTAPETTIDSGPTGTVSGSSVSFAFTSNEAGSTFECKLDGDSFASCTSPQNYSNLSDGAHTFSVRATDAAGNVDATADSYSWTVDATAPAVTAVGPQDGAPDVAIATNVEATFSEAMDPNTISTNTFTLTKQGASQPVAADVSYDLATMKATLDPGGEILDLDPSATYIATIKGGASGAKDLAGNPLTEDESWSFTTAAAPPPQDTDPPETTIDPNSGTVSGSSVSFAFSSDEAGSTFECKLDGAAYSACTSPKGYTNLSNGSHTFEVRATDAAGNVDATPASRTFSVDVSPPPQDTDPPETTIDSGPSEGSTVKPKDATFTFSSDEAGSTFECSLDSGAYSACSSPKRYTGLANGSHTFRVRAKDAAGNTDATSASRTWTVRR
jgi:Bacterial Ig-like domain